MSSIGSVPFPAATGSPSKGVTRERSARSGNYGGPHGQGPLQFEQVGPSTISVRRTHPSDEARTFTHAQEDSAPLSNSYTKNLSGSWRYNTPSQDSSDRWTGANVLAGMQLPSSSKHSIDRKSFDDEAKLHSGSGTQHMPIHPSSMNQPSYPPRPSYSYENGPANDFSSNPPHTRQSFPQTKFPGVEKDDYGWTAADYSQNEDLLGEQQLSDLWRKHALESQIYRRSNSAQSSKSDAFDQSFADDSSQQQGSWFANQIRPPTFQVGDGKPGMAHGTPVVDSHKWLQSDARSQQHPHKRVEVTHHRETRPHTAESPWSFADGYQDANGDWSPLPPAGIKSKIENRFSQDNPIPASQTVAEAQATLLDRLSSGFEDQKSALKAIRGNPQGIRGHMEGFDIHPASLDKMAEQWNRGDAEGRQDDRHLFGRALPGCDFEHYNQRGQHSQEYIADDYSSDQLYAKKWRMPRQYQPPQQQEPQQQERYEYEAPEYFPREPEGQQSSDLAREYEQPSRDYGRFGHPYYSNSPEYQYQRSEFERQLRSDQAYPVRSGNGPTSTDPAYHQRDMYSSDAKIPRPLAMHTHSSAIHTDRKDPTVLGKMVGWMFGLNPNNKQHETRKLTNLPQVPHTDYVGSANNLFTSDRASTSSSSIHLVKPNLRMSKRTSPHPEAE